MQMNKQQLISTLKKPTTIIIIGLLILVLTVGGVAASGILWVPGNNAIAGTPLTPTPTPTASPTPSPSPSPTPRPTIVGATLTANDTNTAGTYIFFRGNTLHITVTCNGTGVRDIQLYNNAAFIETKQTSTAGVAHFYRVVNNPYNYTVKVYNAIP